MEPDSQKLPSPADEKDQKKSRMNAARLMALEAATEFAFLIAVPLIGFLYLGKWLGARYHTKLFIVLGFLLALAVSSISIGKRIQDIRKKLK
ncbi:MAG: AtpZ/AtpI family protein [Patescibacteria group bacterium]|nr:AtpZ/AtpI family protein [Patescibacteria group bacterium]